MDVVNLVSVSLPPTAEWVETIEEVLLTPSTLARAESSTEGNTVVLAKGSEAFRPSRKLGKEPTVEEEPAVEKEQGGEQEPATKYAEEEEVLAGGSI